MSIFRKLGWFFKAYKLPYLIGVFMLVAVAILVLVPPKIIGYTLDDIAAGSLTRSQLVTYLIIIAVIAIATYIMRFYWRKMIFGTSNILAKLLRERLFRHYTKMGPSFYEKKRIGDLMAHATNDISAVQMAAGGGILMLFDSFITGGFVVLAMAITIDWRLTLLALLPLPIMALCTSYYGKLLHKHFGAAQEAFSNLNDKAQESISGVKVVKSFGYEKADLADFTALSEAVVEKNTKVARVDALFDPTISLVIMFSYLLTLGFGTKFILDGAISIGDLVTFTTYLGLLVWPMLAIGMLFNIVERGSASYDRIQSILNEQPEQDAVNALQSVPSGVISFDVKSFTFPGDEQPTLHNVSFTLQAGETLGIVGRTGSGKSAIVKLLLRQFEQFEGQIEYGGASILNYGRDAYMQSIGYVPQEHFLFSTTVKNNIAFANVAAAQAEVEQAAKLAYIHEDILDFTDGYETVVGERGVALSGGQKQRISIARALILKPNLLILDDSLSAVDARTEEAILGNLRAERQNATTMIISHRLSAITHANTILFMEGGTVVEKGTHEELMALKGRYYEMYQLQQLEALVERGGSSA